MKTLFRTIFFLFLFSIPTLRAVAADWTNRLPSIAVGTYAEIPVAAKNHLKVRLGVPGEDDPLSFRAPCPASLFAIRRYAGRLALYADGRPFADIEDKWSGSISVRLPAEVVPSAPDVDDYIQPLGFFTFEDAFMTADKATALQEWSPCSGNWGLHAVTGLTVAGEALANKRGFPTPDRSPNFYSLNGSGEKGVILSGETFQSHYAVRASVQHAAGTNGIVFLMHEVTTTGTEEEDEGTGGLSGYAFTVTTDPTDGRLFFSLRRDCVPGESAGRFLAGAKTGLTPGQWYLLEARVTEDRIVCLVDHREIIRVEENLPSGGMYGLYADAPASEPTCFDDFHAATWQGLSLADLEEGDQSLFVAKGEDSPARKGRFPFPDTSPFAYDVSAQRQHLRVARGDSTTRYYGTPSDLPARVDLAVDLPDGGTAELGVGLTDRASEPSCRLRLRREGRALRLTCLDGDSSDAVFQETVLPADRYRQPLMLTLDATTPGLVSWRVDDDTMAIRVATNAPVGAAGFTLRCESHGPAQASLPMIDRTPYPYTDLFEKNKKYVIDPFMRHWASTEGQWLPYTNNIAWYKDDVFRRVSLDIPLVDGYSLDLDVPDGETNGTFRLVLTNRVLKVFSWDGSAHKPLASHTYPTSHIVKAGVTLSVTNTATVRLDGAVFLVRADGKTLYQGTAPLPHRGRRMRIALPFEQREFLRHFLVHREPVYDFLFTESLHDWVVNGGRWEVVNRFQCYPVWSHMDGENKDSLAALWAKYDFFGDFGLTFIAGMRHGWYQRLGDLNVTLFNRKTSPSDGYSLVVSGWDPDQSQRWSRLFRDGKLLAKSDAMAVPRYRDGNIRRGYEPMLARGRDVHGAWYTINLRKTGKKLAFAFDHLPVLEAEDPNPLDLGGLGIWTYRNSMVVARVRVAAEAVRPRLIPFKAIDRDPGWAAEDETARPRSGLFLHGVPVQMIREGQWQADDPIGYPEVTFDGKGEKTAMTITSVHGSGSFLVSPVFPSNAIPASAVAGWRFEVARSEGARFNFEYTVKTGKGRARSYTHVICGSDETRGPRRISGRCANAPKATPPGKSKIWTPVTVWIPSLGKPLDTSSVSIEGFGNLQPSDLQQGLEGNGPGEWYAIRRMVPIFRGAPNVGEGSEALSDLARDLSKGRAKHLNEVEVPASVDPDEPALLWALPPSDSQGLLAKVRMEPTPVIRIESTLPWPNPLLVVSNVALDGIIVPDAVLEDNGLTIPLVRPLPRGDFSRKVSFSTLSGRPFAQILTSAAFGTKAPPTLVSLEFPPESKALYENFERRTNEPASHRHRPLSASASVRFGDPEQSAYLRIANNGSRNRLAAHLLPGVDVIRSPLFRFRYRGDEMAYVDLVAKNNSFYALSLPPEIDNKLPTPKPKRKARGKRGGRIPYSIGRRGPEVDATLDGAWHTALCEIGYAPSFGERGDVFKGGDRPLMTTSVNLAYRRGQGGNVDQTGCYSEIDFDEIALGPALSPATMTNFAFCAIFDAPNGLAKAEHAIVRDEDGKPSDTVTADWVAFVAADDTWVRPITKPLEEGRYFLLLRATDGRGAVSKTTVFPFLVDATAPSIEETKSDHTHDSIGIPPALAEKFKGPYLLAFEADGDDGAPPTFRDAALAVDGEAVEVVQPQSGFTFFHEDNVATLGVSWPVAFEKAIAQSTNGASLEIVLSGVSDGAGNRAPDYKTSIRIDYAKDKAPPALNHKPRIPYLRDMLEIIQQETFFTRIGPGVTKSIVAATPKTNITFKSYLTTDKRKDHSLETVFPKENPWKLEKNRWMLGKIRLPATSLAKAKDTPPLVFRFSVASGKEKPQVLELPMAVSTNGVPPYLRRPATLPGDQFFDFAIDVPAFVKSRLGDKVPEEVKKFEIVLPGEKGVGLDVAFWFVMDDWKENSVLPVRAYDESGIDGLYWKDVRLLKAEGAGPVKIRPAEMKQPAPGVFLPVLRMRDRAGNASPDGIVLPLPPR